MIDLILNVASEFFSLGLKIALTVGLLALGLGFFLGWLVFA